MKSAGILIDTPSPFHPLEDWVAFAARMERLAPRFEGAARELENARRVIAELEAEQEHAPTGPAMRFGG